MESAPHKKSRTNVAVVGVGYWGKNLVRNFHDLGALTVLCDTANSVEANYRRQYPGVRYLPRVRCGPFWILPLQPWLWRRRR